MLRDAPSVICELPGSHGSVAHGPSFLPAEAASVAEQTCLPQSIFWGAALWGWGVGATGYVKKK